MNFGLLKQIKCINKWVNFDYIILFLILKLISKKKQYEILCIDVDLHIA